MTTFDWPAQLPLQLDWHWEHHLRPLLDGLTDDEYFWEPVAGCWSIRPRAEARTAQAAGGGELVADFEFPEPHPGPVTTIAWRMAHIRVGIFGMRNASHFGRAPIDYQTAVWAGDAVTALAELDEEYALWSKGVAGLDTEGLARPVAGRGPVRRAPLRRARAPHQPRDHPPRRRDPALARPLPRAALSRMRDSAAVESFEGKLAVVTGGGTGMGRELVIQLATAGCSVATCDVNADAMAETVAKAEAAAPPGTRVTAHMCNVADASDVGRFRDEVVEQHATDHVNLVFNNAGIGGGGSFVNAPQEEWERTFGVCWGGVYNCSRAFVPLLVASDDGYLVNTSSVNGFWAAIMPGVPHTAYSSAKFAVKGLSEALLEDFRVNAPHVKVAVVMPGHIGTDIVINSRRIHGGSAPEDMTPAEIEQARTEIASRGYPTDSLDDAQVKALVRAVGEGFRNGAPMSAEQAATVILDGVRAGEWRILVGEDAKVLDEAVRADPLAAYGPDGISLTTLR